MKFREYPVYHVIHLKKKERLDMCACTQRDPVINEVEVKHFGVNGTSIYLIM